jgi:hypothetical protein
MCVGGLIDFAKPLSADPKSLIARLQSGPPRYQVSGSGRAVRSIRKNPIAIWLATIILPPSAGVNPWIELKLLI